MSQQAESQHQSVDRMRMVATALVTGLVMAWLLFQYLNGGVSGHYLLRQKDLPFISNWWSGLLLPVLTWILLGRVQKRLKSQSQINFVHITALFSGGMIAALLISIAFHYDFKPFMDNVLYLFLLLSVVVPIFYSEFILGFILGMTYTFGGILPTAFILIVSSLGFILYRFVRPTLVRVVQVLLGRSREASSN